MPYDRPPKVQLEAGASDRGRGSVMGWEAYDRPRIVPSYELEAERMRLRGWLELSQTLTPTDAWKARIALGLHSPDAHVSRPHVEQAYQLECLRYVHTGEGLPPSPNLHWRLDQDRRCKGEAWEGK